MIAILKMIRGIATIIGLCVLILLVNLTQMSSVVLLPFGRKYFMRFNIRCKHVFCVWSNRAGRWCGNRMIYLGDLPRRENAIIMANHQGMLDIPILWMWADVTKTFGWMKWFVKDELKYVPGPGWGLKFLNALFVKRNWAQDAESIRATFRKILEGDVPFWVMIFPEGTRMKPSKYISSRAYAKRKGLPEYERVLIPRPKGIWASMQGLRSKLTAIYDVSIAYEGPIAPKMRDYFCRGGYIIKVHAERIALEDVPTIEREFNQWITQRFVKKDEWIQRESPQPPRSSKPQSI